MRIYPLVKKMKKASRFFSLSLIVTLGLLSIMATGGGGGGGEPGTLQFSSTAFDVTEGTASVVITVTRTGGSSGAVSVDYATSDNTATQASDYTSASGTLNWADGDAANKTFIVTIVDDSVTESTETFNVSLSNVVTATLGTPSSASVTITDDDNPGILQLSSATYSATEGTDPTVTITVTRTSGSSGAVAVDYATADGTATDPSDYSSTNGTLNWADGDTAAKTFTVAIIDDSSIESSKTFNVTLSNVVTATLGTPSSAAVTIADDDGPGILELSSTSYSVTEGIPTVTITVTRTGGSTGAVSVDYATSDNTATQPSDYTSASATLNWTNGDSADKTFNVTIIDDATVELTEAVIVTLSNVVGTTLGANTSATISITDNDSITITGKVFAPGGTLVFKEPGLLQRMFAALFGTTINAAISDLVLPVAGVTVGVFEILETGVLVSTTPFTTTTTNSFGEYTLAAPLIDSRYIVRAEGPLSEKLDSRIVSSTDLNVDPATDATSLMVATVASNFLEISTQEIIEMHEDIAELITDIETAGADATTLSTRLHNEAKDRVGQFNVLRSKVSLGLICGNVQSAGASPLEGILIIVRDYNDWTTRARTYTDASGNYCLNVPILNASNPDGGNFSGEYIIGAINRTDDSVDPARSASEWLGSGTTYTQHEAIKISVPSGAPVLGTDFTLEAGARITGTVRATGSLAAVEGAQVVIRDFDTRRRLASARVEADGTYRVNVIPGTYLVMARNKTMAPYATEVYDAASGTNNRNLGTPVSANTGDELTIDFVLEAGSLLSGTVSDGAPVIDARVKIDIAGNATSENVDTDRNGDYNVWLKPGSYDLYAYGQRSMAVDLSSSTTVDFSGSVSTISGQLQDSGLNPVGHVTMRLYDATGSFLGLGGSDSNGSFTVYTDQTGDHLLEARITNDSGVGGIIYISHTRLLSGNLINIASVGVTQNLGTISLPDGGVLTGFVYADSSGSTTTPFANFRVQVRDDDDLTTHGSGNTLTDRFLQVRTRGDGSYVVALPAGIYDRVKMRDATGTGNCGTVGNGITIVSGATTVLNFYDGDNACELNP